MKLIKKCLGGVVAIGLLWLGIYYLALSMKNSAKNKKNVIVGGETYLVIPPVTNHSEKNRSRVKFGYLVALKYYEQQTQATRTFLQWQCLGTSSGMRVVEPFIYRSTIAFPFSEMASNEGAGLPLRFGDLMDMKLWNKETSEKYGYPAVASWEEFIKEAPRDVVVVCARYRNPPIIKVPVPGHNYRQGCRKSCFNIFNSSLVYLMNHGFRLVNKVCANFAEYAGSIREDSFMKDILGSARSDRVTVLLNEFRGFFGLYRMPVLSSCGIIHSAVNVSTMPSARLVQDVRQYTMVNFKGRSYTSILVRIEKIILHSRRNVTKCAQETLSILRKLRDSKQLEDSFLAMDIGRFGSRGSRLHNLQSFGEEFFRLLYPTKWSFEDWERSFAIASSTNPAYIANFQRTVAAQGDCMIMVGAGGFQGQARNLYDRYHRDPNSRCVYKVCTAPL